MVGYESKKWTLERHVLKRDWTMFFFTILDAIVNKIGRDLYDHLLRKRIFTLMIFKIFI